MDESEGEEESPETGGADGASNESILNDTLSVWINGSFEGSNVIGEIVFTAVG